MSEIQSTPPLARTPIRLWPGVIAGVLLALVRFVVPFVIPEGGILGMLGALVCALLILVWWLLFSRAPWLERIGAIVIAIVVLLLTSRFVHVSIAGGLMGRMLYVHSIPIFTLAIVVAAVVSQRFNTGARYATMIVAMLIAGGAFTLIRTDGVTGDGAAQFAWRWSATREQQLLSRAQDEPKPVLPAPTPAPDTPAPNVPVRTPEAATIEKPAPATAPVAATPKPVATDAVETRAEWPGFRGPDRDSITHAVRINTDWTASPPIAMWRRPIGPGWSSFAVQGDLLYTQEQRGDDEIVSCHRVSTGEPVWRHRDAARFYESNGGPGPRGTPTLHNGRVYTFGATGILNALDARTGAVVWTRNVSTDTGRRVPDWGFSSSPLVYQDLVIVAASGTMAGYDAATGKPRWVAPAQRGSYSSPHLATIGGSAQVLLQTASGIAGFAPADGKLLWEHSWVGGTTIIQPAVMPNGDVLVNSIVATGGVGTRRLAITHRESGWNVEERWTSNGLKPYFNDFVLHKGHAYGFDGNILAAINLDDGTRVWKGGRYGNGQLVLLPDQDVLLVLSEDGELALVSATPDKFTELARLPAIEGKTWNHPALVNDVLLVRNGEEMAAFKLPRAARAVR